MRTLLVSMLFLAGCGQQTVALKSAVYSFEGLRGREGTPSAIVTASTLELDVITREVKLTVSGAARKFTLAPNVTQTNGCPTNLGATLQDTRALDAPNIQLGELLIDAPLVRADCPEGSGVVVLQQGPASSVGAAPECSTDVLCLTFKKR